MVQCRMKCDAADFIQLMDKAMEVANKLAMGSQQAIRLTKRSLNGWMNMARPVFESSLAMEMLCFMGDDAKEGVAAVKEKRAEKKQDRQDKKGGRSSESATNDQNQSKTPADQSSSDSATPKSDTKSK